MAAKRESTTHKTKHTNTIWARNNVYSCNVSQFEWIAIVNVRCTMFVIFVFLARIPGGIHWAALIWTLIHWHGSRWHHDYCLEWPQYSFNVFSCYQYHWHCRTSRANRSIPNVHLAYNRAETSIYDSFCPYTYVCAIVTIMRSVLLH